jgi:Kef-type K+ transport system membrane component KefB
MAGLMISNTMSAKHSLYMNHTFESVSFLYLSPIFFASIGLQVELEGMTSHIILFAVVLTIVAYASIAWLIIRFTVRGTLSKK